MNRRRLYNPAQLTPEELKASFVARQPTLASMLRVVAEAPSDRPCQHMLLVGPRGMGKTTLGLRFLQAVRESPELNRSWQTVPFFEENYEICGLGEFWLAALRHLTRVTGDSGWATRADALARDIRDAERQAAYALATLAEFCGATGKRLILFVENLDVVFGQLGSERSVHALRATLIERSDILLVGSANAVFDAIRSHGEPFYEFFRLFELEGFDQAETLAVVNALAARDGEPQESPEPDPSRLETIRRLTGGNPRLLAIAYRLLAESPLGSAFEDLEQLVDEQTPYFKARIEELPIQARKVFLCLAERWEPTTAREVSEAANLTSSHASAQLKQLVDKGYARETRVPGKKKIRYEVADRFCNIYFLLRFSRPGRPRIERLVDFLQDLFGPASLPSLSWATLAALRHSTPEQAADWLSVLVRYVARNPSFDDRMRWLREALEVAEKETGSESSVTQQIDSALADLFDGTMRDGFNALKAGRLDEAAKIFRKAFKEWPEGDAMVALATPLISADRPADLVEKWRQVRKHVAPNESPEVRKGFAMLLELAGEFIFWHRTDFRYTLPRVQEALESANELGLFREAAADAESLIRLATQMDPARASAWLVLAYAILFQNDAARPPEAEACIRQSVALAPQGIHPQYALSWILGKQGSWQESLESLKRAVSNALAAEAAFLESADCRETKAKLIPKALVRQFLFPDMVASQLMQAASAGHVRQARRLLEATELSGRMEPLWHALRMELGEDIEPLPAEILDAANEARKRIRSPNSEGFELADARTKGNSELPATAAEPLDPPRPPTDRR